MGGRRQKASVDIGRSEELSTIIHVNNLQPMTLRQVYGATREHSEAPFIYGGYEVNHVLVVAVVRLIEPNLPRRICFSLEDGTSGTIRAFKWFSRDEGVDTLNREQAMSIKENTYVRVWGQIRRTGDVNIISIQSIVPVTDHNEVFFHCLRAIEARLYWRHRLDASTEAEAPATETNPPLLDGARSEDRNASSAISLEDLSSESSSSCGSTIRHDSDGNIIGDDDSDVFITCSSVDSSDDESEGPKPDEDAPEDDDDMSDGTLKGGRSDRRSVEFIDMSDEDVDEDEDVDDEDDDDDDDDMPPPRRRTLVMPGTMIFDDDGMSSPPPPTPPPESSATPASHDTPTRSLRKLANMASGVFGTLFRSPAGGLSSGSSDLKRSTDPCPTSETIPANVTVVMKREESRDGMDLTSGLSRVSINEEYRTGANTKSSGAIDESQMRQGGQRSSRPGKANDMDPYGHLSKLARAIILAIHEDRGEKDAGVHVSTIVKKLSKRGVSPEGINDAIEELLEAGQIFPTIDDLHFDVVDS